MGTLTTNLLTFEEFERLPDEPGKRELLDGEVIEMPPADLEHYEVSIWIYHLLRDALTEAHSRGQARELGKVCHEVGYKFPGSRYVQPDVSVTHASQTHGKYWDGAPAIAIEVISDSNTQRQMEKKLSCIFATAREVWRVYRDPLHFVIHLADSSRTIREGSVSTPLLPGFELPLSALQSLLDTKS
jgi:Uma2 family endonuclease